MFVEPSRVPSHYGVCASRTPCKRKGGLDMYTVFVRAKGVTGGVHNIAFSQLRPRGGSFGLSTTATTAQPDIVEGWDGGARRRMGPGGLRRNLEVRGAEMGAG